MSRKRDLSQLFVSAIVAATIVGTGMLVISHKDRSQSLRTGSPQKNSYPEYVFKINQGQPWGKLNSPMQALVHSGRLYVADTGNARVLVFDLKGKYLFALEEKESKENKRLRFPYGLAANNQGIIYVADPVLGKVLMFNYLGNFMGYFNEDNKNIIKPAGIFVRKDRIYVSDIGVHKVFVFNKKGKLLFSIGSGHYGSSQDDLYYPNAIAVDSKDEIYISDTMNNRIQVFDKTGKYLESITGVEGMKLSNPRGIAMDADEDIFVAGTMSNSVKVFDKSGTFLYDINKDDKSALTFPNGISLDQYGNVYVTDIGTNQVLIFKK